MYEGLSSWKTGEKTEMKDIREKDDKVTIRLTLEELAFNSGALVFGVADALKFKAAPDGYRPSDLLPGAKSVIVLGGAKPKSGDWAATDFRHMELSSTNDRITGICMRLSNLIERKFGYYAVTVPPGVDEGQKPFLDISLAAELAGCGTSSLAGPILSPKHGFVYLGALITTLELPFDQPLNEPSCPAPECIDMYSTNKVTPCTKVCNIEDGGCLGGKIKNGQWEDRVYDVAKCTSRVYNHWIPTFQKVLEDTLEEDDLELRRMKINSSLFTRTLWSMTYSNISQGQCFECIRVCPVDERTRKLR